MARGATEQVSGWARGWTGSTLLPARQDPIAGVQADIAARVNAHRLQKEAADALGLVTQSLSLRKRKERLFAGKNKGLEQRDLADKAQELTEEKKQHILEDKAAAYDKLLADQDPDTEERYCVDFAAAAAPGFVRAGYLEDEESTPAKERRLNDGSSSPRDQHGMQSWEMRRAAAREQLEADAEQQEQEEQRRLAARDAKLAALKEAQEEIHGGSSAGDRLDAREQRKKKRLQAHLRKLAAQRQAQ